MKKWKFRAWDKENDCYVYPNLIGIYNEGEVDQVYTCYGCPGDPLDVKELEQFEGQNSDGMDIYVRIGNINETGAKDE